jgi:hypothetical protein
VGLSDEERKRREELEPIAAAIGGCVEGILTDLRSLSAAARVRLEAVEHSGSQPTRADLAAFRQDLQARLRHPDRCVDGIGLVAAPDYLSDSPYWLEWWRYDRQGRLEFVTHQLNPQKDSFYDYPSRRWYASTAATGTDCVTGPYVDLGGTNTYTVTLCVPVMTAWGLAALAGADMAAANFERFLISAGFENQIVLVNADLRVIASNSAHYLPGDLLTTEQTESWTRIPVPAEVLTGPGAWQVASPA